MAARRKGGILLALVGWVPVWRKGGILLALAGWVPVRLPDTISVDKKLPPGAAAVLINPRHTFTDLYLPIRAEELAWVEAIDGQRSIGEIVSDPADRDAARALFERLWWYDQIVFNRSPRS